MKEYLKIIFLIEKYNMNLNKKSKIDNGRNKCHTLKDNISISDPLSMMPDRAQNLL